MVFEYKLLIIILTESLAEYCINLTQNGNILVAPVLIIILIELNQSYKINLKLWVKINILIRTYQS